jgi:hypothetical protein
MNLVPVTLLLLGPLGTSIAQTNANAEAKATIMRIEQEMVDGLLKGDASSHERHKADTLIVTMPHGTVVQQSTDGSRTSNPVP